MELKHNKFNGKIVLAKILNPFIQFFFLKNVEIALKNESYKLFFEEDVYIVQKTILSITFSPLVQIE